MTLLWVDGFDLGDHMVKYPVANGTSSTTTRTGVGRSVINASAAVTAEKTIPASGTVVSGLAWMAVLAGSGQGSPLSFYSDTGATQHITVTWRIGEGIKVRRGGGTGTVLATGAVLLAVNTWHHIEVEVTVADSGGTVKVWLNGAATPEIDFTGDTRNGGTSTNIDKVVVETTGGVNGGRHADDWYILNTAGSVNNARLGDRKVVSLLPNGNGNYSQLVGSDGNSTDNYLLVDEAPYSTADYNGSAAVNNKDSYALPSLAAGIANVHGVQACMVAAKNDAGAREAATLLRSSTTDQQGTARALSTTYATYTDLYENDPATATAWTVSGVNAAEVGMVVTT